MSIPEEHRRAGEERRAATISMATARARKPGWFHRWTAKITYRSEAGPIEVEHEFEEFDELGAMVELGPDWETIASIQIALAEPSDLTLEESERLDDEPDFDDPA